MNKNNNKMDLLGNAPVPQALMALGIPIMIGMLINALYNLVDAYFIGGLGESQMGAISIAFPLGQVVVGLGLMFGNGAASYLSRLLGRGDVLHVFIFSHAGIVHDGFKHHDLFYSEELCQNVFCYRRWVCSASTIFNPLAAFW